MKNKLNIGSKYKRLFKDTLIFALGNFGSKFIVFLLVPLYTNFLTTEEYGISDMVFTVSQLFIPVISLVIFDAVMRFGLQERDHPQNVLFNGVLVWFAGSIVMLLLMPLVALIPSVSEWKWYLYAYVSGNILLPILLNYLKAIDKNMCYSIICILQTAINAVLNIILLVLFHDGIRGYLLSNVASTIIASILCILMGRIIPEFKKGRFNSELFRDMLKYSAPLIFNNLAWWIIQSSDKVMIQAMVGMGALGLYSVATRIPSLINVVVSVFQQAWGISSTIEMDSSNDTSFYSEVFDGYSCMVFLACIGINTVIKPFMSIYVGAEFEESWLFVPLLLVAAVYSAIAAYYGSMYGALKKSVNNMLTTVLAGLVNIAANYICILHMGAIGAVVGTVISYIVLAFARMLDVLRYVKMSIPWKRYLFNSLLIIVHALLVMGGRFNIPVSIAVIILFFIINRNFVLMLKDRIKK